MTENSEPGDKAKAHHHPSAAEAREILADARDVVADARDALADARELQALVDDETRQRRDTTADARDDVSDEREALEDERDRVSDERERLSDERDEIAEAADHGRYERDITADARDVRADAREHTSILQQEDAAALLALAEQRDVSANRRDTAANKRDMKATLASFLIDSHDQAAFEARGHARQDRKDSRDDRTASAGERWTLSSGGGDISLPRSIPTQRGESTPLGECTAEELSSYSTVLLRQSIEETREAIDTVDKEGLVSARAKELVDASREHHEHAESLIRYVSEWQRTGSRPPDST